MLSIIIPAIIKDWIESLFLMNTLLSKEKIDSLNMFILINITDLLYNSDNIFYYSREEVNEIT